MAKPTLRVQIDLTEDGIEKIFVLADDDVSREAALSRLAQVSLQLSLLHSALQQTRSTSE
jgi:hypothetical protein